MKKNNKDKRDLHNFKIPQFDLEDFDYINTKKFERSVAASPFYGSKVKDKLYIEDIKGTIDISVAYDNFRNKEDRKISDEQKLAKYGTIYNEFDFINEKDRKENLGVDYDNDSLSNDEDNINEDVTLDDSEIINEVNNVLEYDNEIDLDNSYINDSSYNIDASESNNQVEDEYNELSTTDLKVKFSLDDEYFPQDEDDSIENSKNNILEVNDDDLNEATTNSNEVDDDILLYEKQINGELNEDNNVYDLNNLDYSNYKLPDLSIFNKSDKSDEETPEWVIKNKDIINQTLLDFDISGEVIDYTNGPTFTRYEIMLSPGVKVNKISTIKDNIQMALSAQSIRVLAPIPGKSTVGIEAPNIKKATVFFGDIVDEDFVRDRHPLRVAFGKDIDSKSIVKGIEDMPHMLVAGATKSGKSVCINTILISLLIKNKPDELKLILVDPKKVELSFYEGIPHLAAPVITDMHLASLTLKWVVDEMDRRYDLFKEVGVKNIETYIKKRTKKEIDSEKLPYIIVVIDELADLMMNFAKEVEDHIERITHMARAVGIHLIVATQRPTVQVISGNIKANIPTRVAFKVATSTDSVVILDEGGAEDLLGRGDMFIKDNDGLARLQGCYLSDEEIINVCEHIKKEAPTNYLFSPEELEVKETLATVNGITKPYQGLPDEVYYSVAKYCVEKNYCSLNDLSTAFCYGWNRCRMIVDRLEELKIVGPKSGNAKSREILVSLEELNKIFNK